MCLPQVVVPPLHSMLAVGRCNLYKKVWRETLKLSAWHLEALQAMPIDWTFPLIAIFLSTLQPGTLSAARSDWRASQPWGII